jgi:poly-gamma-glutamate synthesis protein (capsule biosynthesis protein)
MPAIAAHSVTAVPTPIPVPTATPPDPRAPKLDLALGQGADATRLGLALAAELSRAGYAVVIAETGGPADVYVGYSPPADFHTWPLTATQFVPVVSFWQPITEVTYTDLERVFHGEVGTWNELGSIWDTAVVPLALQNDPAAPLLAPAGKVLTDSDALVSALEQHPGGIALIPLDQVDARLRALRVDGYDPLLSDEVEPGAPLARHLSLGLSTTAHDDLVELISAFADNRRPGPLEAAIEVVFAGDVIPARMAERRILALGGDYILPFAKVAPSLRSADLTIANLDSALSDQIEPPVDPYTLLFVASGRVCEGLLHAGIDGISLATNHSMNFGQAGLSDTITLLEQAGITPFGAGMNLEQARRPALFEVKGITFALLGYDAVSGSYYGAGETSAGTANAEPDHVIADIEAARKLADVVIPYFHWGWEYTNTPNTQQQELAHHAIKAGADAVIGSHTHWVQAFESYQGVPIIYSLGNFVFDQMWSIETRRSIVVRLIFRGPRLVNMRLQAVQIEDYFQPHVLPAAEAEDVFQLIRDASPEWPVEQGGANP